MTFHNIFQTFHNLLQHFQTFHSIFRVFFKHFITFYNIFQTFVNLLQHFQTFHSIFTVFFKHFITFHSIFQNIYRTSSISSVRKTRDDILSLRKRKSTHENDIKSLFFHEIFTLLVFLLL